MRTINLNDRVAVTLTDRGVAIREAYYARNGLTRYMTPLPDDRRVVEQLWQIMHVYGEACFIGFDPPFETTIELLDDTPEGQGR